MLATKQEEILIDRNNILKTDLHGLLKKEDTLIHLQNDNETQQMLFMEISTNSND